MSVLIYQDYLHNHGLLYQALCRHFGIDNVGYCDAQSISEGCLDRNIRLLVMPGGADLYYCEKLNGDGTGLIKAYVENGGTYLGICAGAYFACTEIDWARDQGAFAIRGPRELAFFSGTARGPVFEFIEDGGFDKSWHAAAPLSYDDGLTERSLTVFYEAGPVFVPHFEDANVRVLARYDSLPDRPAAIVECRVGKGKAVLCSPHLEVTHDGLNRRTYRHLNQSFEWDRSVAGKLQTSEADIKQLWSHLLNRCVRGM